jgi:O-antigen/teichoic acid export membrane protein
MSAAAAPNTEAMARGVAAGWLQVGVSLITGPIYTALVLGTLPREEAGFWLVVLSLAAYFALFDVGLGPTLTRFVAFSAGVARSARPERFATARPAATPAELFRTAQCLYVALAAGLVLVGLLVGPRLFTQASGLALAGARQDAWTLFVLGCAANLLAAPCYATAAGLGLVSVQRLAWAGAQTLGLATSGALLLTGWGTRGVAIAWAVQNSLLLAGGLLLWSRRPELRVRARWRTDVARALVRPSVQWAGINLGGVLVLASGPLIVSRQVGPEAVPQFAVLRQLAETMYLLALVPAQMSEPFVARFAAAGDHAGVVALLRRNVRLVGSLLAVAAIVAAVLGREVIAAWVGIEHFAGYVSLWLMLLLYVLEAHHVAHAIVVMATGRVVFLRVALLAGGATVVAGLAFARWWGVPGMIVGMLVAQLTTNTWYVPWYSLRHLRVRRSEYLRWLQPLVPLAAVALALSAGARLLLLSSGVVGVRSVLGTVALVGLLMLPFAWRGVLTPEERGRLARGWRRLGART